MFRGFRGRLFRVGFRLKSNPILRTTLGELEKLVETYLLEA